jgi:putative ABC transport system permease protein
MTNQPPKSADRFLGWFCRGELLEEVLGDLHEYYGMERAEKGAAKAWWLYWFHVLHFLRPFAIKRKTHPSNTGINNITMYKSYFKFAWRNMTRHKLNALMNLLSLSVGMACFVFVFIYVKTELSYDQFHKDADRVHRVVIDLIESNGKVLPDATTPPALAAALKRELPEVETTVRLFPGWGSKFLIGASEEQKFYEEDLIRTDSTFFDVFSFPFLYGNPETALDNPGQLVITRKTALKYFGREDVIGETLTVFSMNNARVTITGVLEDIPENSHFKFDFLTRLTFNAIDSNWGWWNYYTYVKLNQDASLENFDSKLAGFYENARPEQEQYAPIYTQALTDIHLKSNLKWELDANGNISNVYIFVALGLFILLISCINYLNLTVGHSLKRLKEIGLRKVFGAHKRSLMSQFLIEALVMVFLSVLIGSLLAEVLFYNLGDTLGKQVSLFTPDNLPSLGIIALGGLLTGIVAGLYPALHLSSFKVVNAVKGVLNKNGKSAVSLRHVLLVLQFTISGIMIIGTLVVFKQLNHLQNTDRGFDAEQVLVIDNGRGISDQKSLKVAISQLASVAHVGVSSGVVGGLNWTTSVGYPDPILLNYMAVDPEYIEAMNFELVAGRNFSREIKTDAQGPNIMVNEQGLKELGFTLEDVGKPRPMFINNDTIQNGNIIGVLKDFHFANFKSEIKPFGFFFRDTPLNFITVKTSTNNLAQTIDQLENIWGEVANGAPFEYFFLDETFAALYEQESKLSNILIYLTFLTLFIAFVGMFAIANMTVKDKLKEIAIRKVLGASASSVSAMVTQKFIILVLIANMIGMPVAYLLMNRWLEDFAYRTAPGAMLFVIALASTLLVAWVTVGSQSIRAAVSSPVKSLRQD